MSVILQFPRLPRAPALPDAIDSELRCIRLAVSLLVPRGEALPPAASALQQHLAQLEDLVTQLVGRQAVSDAPAVVVADGSVR